ncbi:MAG: DUF7524 family protein [Halodesulfurarchaeum sp.]
MSGLTVYLNRSGLNTVETDRERVRADGDLRVSLENHGKPTHVHLHLDDDLAMLGTVKDPHLFVPREERREALLRITEGATGDGRLEVTAGYGQAEASVTIAVGEHEEPPAEASSESHGAEAGSRGSADSDRPTDAPLDPARLRNPAVIGAGGGAALVVFLWLLADPLVALSTALVAVLSVVAAAAYCSAWTPLTE